MIEAQLVLLCYVVGCRKDCDQSQISFKQSVESWVSKVIRNCFCFTCLLWLARKTRAILSTKQMQNLNKNSQSVGQSFILRSVSQSVCRSLYHLVSQSFTQSVSQSVNHALHSPTFKFLYRKGNLNSLYLILCIASFLGGICLLICLYIYLHNSKACH